MHHHTTHRVALLSLVLLLAGCTSAVVAETPVEASPSARAAPAPVDVAPDGDAARGTTDAPVIEATGTAEAARSADVAAAASTTVIAILIAEGDHVRRGDPMIRLDARTARLNASQARAAAAAARASADRAVEDLERLSPLAERGTISSSRLLQLETQRRTAERSAEAAEAAAASASSLAANSTVRAPFDGVVTSIDVEVGEMPGGSVARVLDLSTLQVRARLDESALSAVHVGDEVDASFPSLDLHLAGRVVRIGRELDAATRTFEAVVEIPNPEERLPSGLFTVLTFSPTAAAPSPSATVAAPEAHE